MRKGLYIVRDEVSSIYGPVFQDENDAAAQRNFVGALSDGSVPDYVARDSVLYCLGTVDFADDSVCGTFFDVPRRVCAGITVLSNPVKDGDK